MARAVDKCEKFLSQKSLQIIKENEFNVSRSLDHYAVLFGPRFVHKFQSLNRKSHWLDAGAGSASAIRMLFEPHFFASVATYSQFYVRTFKDQPAYTADEKSIQNFLRERKRIGRTKFGKPKKRVPLDKVPNVTAVTYVKPEVSGFSKDIYQGKLKLFEGRLFENIPQEDLLSQYGRVDLLTDLFGVFSYTANPAEVLEKYLNLLKEDGEIHILLGELNYDRSLASHRVELKTGKEISLIEWLAKLQGVSVTLVETDVFGFNPMQSAIIKKTAGSFYIPKLKLVGLNDSEMPPIRFFEEQ